MDLFHWQTTWTQFYQHRKRRMVGKPIDLLYQIVWSANIEKSVTFRSLQLLWDI